MSEITKMLNGYRLTTAEILYHRPDYPDLLQTYLWQEYDLAPRYPKLHGFLQFWQAKLDGRLHSVRIASTGIIAPYELNFYQGEHNLH